MYKNNQGVSPVIGILLITLILLSLIVLTMSLSLNLANNILNPEPNANVSIEYNEITNTITATVNKNNNVDYFIFQRDTVSSQDSKFIGESNGEITNVGSSASYNAISSEDTGDYSIIAVLKNGEEFTIKEKNITV